MSVLEVAGLARSFGGVPAVDGVSFTVDAGEMLALIGPNGAGKSTCFNMLGGQIRPDRGTIHLLGQDVTAFSPRALSRLGVGRTFQITATFASMSVRENVQMALIARHRQVWRFGRAADRRFGDAAMALLDQVGLAGLAPGPAGTLAYGDLKRLELAMALACDPMLLLMDEPTAGMAASERSALMALVRSLASARRLAVLFTEHDMDVVFTCADRILVLDHGTLIAAGDAAAIQADGRVRDIYLGAL